MTSAVDVVEHARGRATEVVHPSTEQLPHDDGSSVDNMMFYILVSLFTLPSQLQLFTINPSISRAVSNDKSFKPVFDCPY